MDPFVGEIRIFGYDFAPRGWANCDGQMAPVANYTELFSVIGNIYGGDGKTTMGLPNLQGCAPMHTGSVHGLPPRWIGQAGGATTVTLDQHEIPGHTHQLMASEDDADNDDPGDKQNRALATVSGAGLYNLSTLVDMAPEALPSVGGGQPHNNLQPYQVLRFCIALVGVFPDRS